MNAPLNHQTFALHAQHPARSHHQFDLPPVLHAAVFGGFGVYLAIMWLAFSDRELIIPFAIFFVFLAGFYIVPALWAKVADDGRPKPDWLDFSLLGIDCETGHVSAPSAMVQILIMPAMLIVWGLIIAIIQAIR